MFLRVRSMLSNFEIYIIYLFEHRENYIEQHGSVILDKTTSIHKLVDIALKNKCFTIKFDRISITLCHCDVCTTFWRKAHIMESLMDPNFHLLPPYLCTPGIVIKM